MLVKLHSATMILLSCLQRKLGQDVEKTDSLWFVAWTLVQAGLISRETANMQQTQHYHKDVSQNRVALSESLAAIAQPFDRH